MTVETYVQEEGAHYQTSNDECHNAGSKQIGCAEVIDERSPSEHVELIKESGLQLLVAIFADQDEVDY